MITCKIQWVSHVSGKPTPDDNPAVGVVYRKAYYGTAQGAVRSFRVEESERFPICAEHLKRFHRDHLENHGWIFEPYTDCCCES